MKKTALSISVLFVSVVFFGLSIANADSLTVATSTSGFNDTASWPGGCTIGLSSISATSTNGINVTATDTAGHVSNDTENPQGCSYGGWNGNFAAGENLVYTGAEFSGNNSGSGPITLSFSNSVSGVGTQFQYAPWNGSEVVYGPFTAQITAYNGSTVLGTFTESGASSSDANDSAIFLGITDSTGADITSAVLSVFSPDGTPSGDFTIGQVSLVEAPEPGTLSLLAVGILALGGIAIRRKDLRLLA